MSDLFSQEDIVIFAILTLYKQWQDGLIDEEHLPEGVDVEDIATSNEALALETRCGELGLIPHQNDILNATASFYDDEADFAKMFEVLCERAVNDPEMKQILNPN